MAASEIKTCECGLTLSLVRKPEKYFKRLRGKRWQDRTDESCTRQG
jgi:hypothetical protein